MKDALGLALRPVKRRIRFARLWRFGGWGLLAGAAAGFSLLLLSRFIPLPQRWSLAAGLTLLGGSACGLAGLLWPVRDERAAKAADACGLKERAQTALALAGRDDAMALLQRQDACRALGELDTAKIPLSKSAKGLAAFAVLLLLMGGTALLPDPQADAVRRMEGFSQRTQEAEKRLEAEEKALDGKSQKKEVQALRRLLSDLRRSLKQARGERDALLAIDEAEKRLERLKNSMRLGGAASAGLSALSDALESGDEQAMKEAAQALMQNAEESAALLSQAAAQMDGDMALGARLAQSALSAGNLSQLQEALSQMSLAEWMDAMERMESLMNQLRGLTGGGTGLSAAQGQGENGGEGKNPSGGGRGSTHLDQGYQEDSGRQRGQGADAPEYRENAYEAIYDPTRLDAQETAVREGGARGPGESVQLQTGPGQGSLSGQVPYRQVVGEYEAAAAQAAEQARLPSLEQSWVNDYFAAITE